MQKTAKFSEELSSLIRARYPLLHVETFEEGRCLALVTAVCEARSSKCYVWSRTEGVLHSGKVVADVKDPARVLEWFEQINEKAVLLLKDFHPYFKDPGIVRKIKDLGQKFKRVSQNLIFVSSVQQVPVELSKDMVLLEMPLPERDEIEVLLDQAISCLEDSKKPVAEEREALIEGASGLTAEEIENVLAKSIVSQGRIESTLVQSEKQQIVKKSGLLEFIAINDVAPIGGLHSLRAWLRTRRQGFGAAAREIGLPLPKGLLLVGVPGCGKSLTAMAVGREWKMPLLRLDIGRLFGGLVGSSESNVRRAVATCEAVAPCVLWIDEIEKGLSGSQSGGSSDGGTASRVFGTLLTWMQEKRSAVFVLATANDISQLPPEFLRKGRFDEIFFVDLPTASERKEIFDIHLDRYKWSPAGWNADDLVESTQGFSGAEIEQAVVSARYAAFAEEQEFSQDHILTAIRETVPLSKTMADRLDGLRSWAKFRARPASLVAEAAGPVQFLDRTQALERARNQSKEVSC